MSVKFNNLYFEYIKWFLIATKIHKLPQVHVAMLITQGTEQTGKVFSRFECTIPFYVKSSWSLTFDLMISKSNRPWVIKFCVPGNKFDVSNYGAFKRLSGQCFPTSRVVDPWPLTSWYQNQ